MCLKLKVELADSSGSDGDDANASAVKRRLRMDSNPTMVKASTEELLTIGSMRVICD